MIMRKIPFVVGEWYHCYSRGIDKRFTFLDENDYNRFLETVHLTNQLAKIHRSNFENTSRQKIWTQSSRSRLVAIGAYCLMPNHFHFLMKETRENGISIFMQKLGTAYAMYFNKKYERTGGLFTSPFRAKHIANDRYLRHLVNYIHFNPTDLLETNWQGDALPVKADDLLKTYPFSSFFDYCGSFRPQRILLDGR